MEIKDYCKIYNNVIPKNICEKLINDFKNHPNWKIHEWYNPVDDLSEPRHNKELSVLGGVQLGEYTEPYINQTISKYFSDIGTKILVGQYLNVRLNRYSQGTLMSDHFDLIRRNKDDGIPVLSIVLIFNDDYTGGEFIMNNEILDLKQGDILMFPSTFLYSHEVKAVTSGTRYSGVTWAY